jgi:hypothetical protein
MRCRQKFAMAFNEAILSLERKQVKQSGQGLLSFGRNCGENNTVIDQAASKLPPSGSRFAWIEHNTNIDPPPGASLDNRAADAKTIGV